MCKNLKQLSFALLALSAGLFSASAVTVPNVFSANMVLQRDTDVPVWGWGDDGETVTVTFRDQTVSTKVKDGKWTVKLHSLKTGDPATLTITGNNTIDFTNVVVGEVWVASGQSNMEFSMGRKPLTAADLPSCTNTMIRWLNVRNTRLDEPTNNVQATWLVSSPQTMPTNSAVAYYFAKDLQKTLGVPIGIMESDWGGTPIEAWLRREVIAANPVHKKQVIDAQDAALALYQKEIAAPEKSAPPKKGAKKTDAPKKPWMPGELYNGMIAPLIPYAIKGVIWYQGENNSSSPTNALRYHSLFPDLIKSWRADWHQGDFPFLSVQLAPFATPAPRCDWPSIREAQLLATKNVPKVGMAVITDIGEEHDIHPAQKPPVGARLALAARSIAYGEKIEYSGPIYSDMKTKKGRIIVSFTHAQNGFDTTKGDLKGFTVCGEDHKFVPARAVFDGIERVAVGSPEVPHPVAARYGWSNWMDVNLWNKEGLPASPFRTDDFPLVTP